MELLSQFDAMHAVAGLLVGILVGFTGVGGGSLMTPVLVLIFGVNPQTAVGTDLLYAATTKTAGSAVHGWRESVDWRIVRRLALGSLPAAALTLIALNAYGRIGQTVSHAILIVLGVMLLLTAIAVTFQERLIGWAKSRRVRPERQRIVPTIVLGAVIGALVSLSSVGAGAIGVTALLMIYPDIRINRIVGSDIAHAVPLTLLGGIGHWVIGDINLVLLANLLVGSIPGVILGSFWSSRGSDDMLRPALAAVLFISGAKLLV